jgi:hypothetical protein
MSDDTRAKIVVDGDVSPLRQRLREATADLKRMGVEGEGALSRMTGPLGSLQSKFIAVGALLAGGKVFGAAVDESKRLTGEANQLARALGISAGEASVLNVALGDIYVGADDFAGAAQHLGRQLRTNEADLNALGLKTRDANGQFRNMKDLVFSAVEVLKSYKEGTDRNLAAQTLFAKGAGEAAKLVKLQADSMEQARIKAESLGLVIGVQNVEAAKEHKAAMNDVDDVLSAIKKTIGDAVIPVLTQFGKWFAEVGPYAVVAFKGTIGGLISLFWGLKTAAGMAFQLINAAVVQVAEPIRAVSVAFWKLIQGDFEGAKAEIANIPKVWSQAWNSSFDSIVASATEARDKMWNLFATPDAMPAPSGKGKGYVAPPKDEKDKEPSFMATYEARLAELKNQYEQENGLRQFSKEQELAYWRELQAAYQLTSKDRLAIAKRTATLEVEIRRQATKELRDLEQVAVDSRRAASLAQIQYEEQQAKFARENGEITKVQLVELEEDFARRRFEIEYQALLERLELAKSDPNMSPAEMARIKEQLLEVERNYQLRRGELGQQKKEANGWGGFFDDAGSAFGQMANSMLTRARTLQQQLASVFMSIYQSFVTNLITKPLGEWIAAQVRMLAIKMGFLSQERAADTAATAAAVIAKKAEGIGAVQANAAEAATGAAASQAMIPIIGPELAMAAMAETYAAVSGFGLGALASASRGYDIPKGLNPLTQLHEEEMVLPQKYANVIRGFAQQGGAAGGEGGSLAIHAESDKDVVRVGQLKKLLRQMSRNFVDVKR